MHVHHHHIVCSMTIHEDSGPPGSIVRASRRSLPRCYSSPRAFSFSLATFIAALICIETSCARSANAGLPLNSPRSGCHVICSWRSSCVRLVPESEIDLRSFSLAEATCRHGQIEGGQAVRRQLLGSARKCLRQPRSSQQLRTAARAPVWSVPRGRNSYPRGPPRVRNGPSLRPPVSSPLPAVPPSPHRDVPAGPRGQTLSDDSRRGRPEQPVRAKQQPAAVSRNCHPSRPVRDGLRFGPHAAPSPHFGSS